MNKIKALALGITLLALSPSQSPAASLLFEGFESYVSGTTVALDATSPGPNAGPNGGPGTAWWSLNSPSFFVVNAETYTIPNVITNFVSPHGGTNMVRGHPPNGGFFDTIYYNIAYRLNNTNGFSGNVQLDWWFYDPLGTNASANHYRDNISLISYLNVPTDTDYFGAPDDPGFPAERLSLGADSIERPGYKSTNYQAQILNPGSTAGSYDVANGWFNLTNKIRSVGWHHARIAVSPVNTNNSFAPVAFYIDNMVNPALTNTTEVTNNFNIVEMDADYDFYTGYFDDISFGSLPPPTVSIAAAAGKAVVTWPGAGFTLQTSTNLAGSNFVDVLTATSPYTNTITSTPLFFRLRQ